MNAARLVILLILFIATNGCQKTAITPTTGSLQINTTPKATASYYLMSEAAVSGSHLTLRDGNVSGASSFVIDDLNPGDYILGLNNTQHAVQVTAGQQRVYSF